MEYIDVETISPEKNKDDQPSQTSMELNFDRPSSVSQPDPDLEDIDVETISPEKNKDDQPSQTSMKLNFDQPNSVSQPNPDIQSHVFIRPHAVRPSRPVIWPHAIRRAYAFHRPPACIPRFIIFGPQAIYPPHAIIKRPLAWPLLATLQASINSSHAPTQSPPDDSVKTVHHFSPLIMQVLKSLLAAAYHNLTDEVAKCNFIAIVYLLPGMHMPLLMPVFPFLQTFNNELAELDKKYKRKHL